MSKKLMSVCAVLVSVVSFGVVSSTSVDAASCSNYSANGYFAGSWFSFSSNSTVASMISSGELKRVFTTDANGNSKAIPDNRNSLACVAPTFRIQSSGARGLYLVGSGWSYAGFSELDLVSIINEYIAARFIYPTTTVKSTFQPPTFTVAPKGFLTPPTTAAPSGSVSPTTTVPSIVVSKVLATSSLAKRAGIVVSKGAKLSISVSAKSLKICRASGAGIKGLKAGTCAFKVTMKPLKGKPISKTVSLKVSK